MLTAGFLARVANNTGINWSTSSTTKSILTMLTEEDYDLRHRDDLQICTFPFAVSCG